MRVLAAALHRDQTGQRTVGPNPFVLHVQFQVQTPDDVWETAALMRALEEGRQDIEIRIGTGGK